jgi:hypothetical protein
MARTRAIVGPNSVKSGGFGISLDDPLGANSTWGGNEHMQVGLRQRNSGFELAVLYRRRETVLSLIRSLERYHRATARRIRGCLRPTSPAAA